MAKQDEVKNQNLAAEWVVSAPYLPSGTSWVVGWAFADKEQGERVMREVARRLANKGQ